MIALDADVSHMRLSNSTQSQALSPLCRSSCLCLFSKSLSVGALSPPTGKVQGCPWAPRVPVPGMWAGGCRGWRGNTSGPQVSPNPSHVLGPSHLGCGFYSLTSVSIPVPALKAVHTFLCPVLLSSLWDISGPFCP